MEKGKQFAPEIVDDFLKVIPEAVKYIDEIKT